MKRLSFRSISVLSLVLMAASAATAALTTNKVKEDANGILVPNGITNTASTCQTDPGNVNTNCHNTTAGLNVVTSSASPVGVSTGAPTSADVDRNTTVDEDLQH